MATTVRNLLTEVRNAAAALDRKVPGLTKMRKADLIELRNSLWAERDAETGEEPTGVIAAPDGLGDPGDAEPMIDEEDLELAQAATRALFYTEEDPLPVGNVPLVEHHPKYAKQASDRLGAAVEAISDATRKAAQAMSTWAWSGYTAVVRSMGHTVRGRVVATELRTPDPDGGGRVLLVVEHPNGAPGRKATRTLHRLVDVKLEPLAS
jgi:hypothetical protein